MYELKTTLPGISQLHVQLWDKDTFVADDLIGETIIDLENRFFSKIWRNLPYVPVEKRELFVSSSELSRG
jgi:Ca2+-dependent lipid-binding protein